MPIDPRAKTAKFKFGLTGLVSKEDPTLLADGNYRSCSNMEVVQESSLSTRAGKKQIGAMADGTQTCYMIRKMVVNPGENPSTPSSTYANPRYLGIRTTAPAYDLYRTLDYLSFGSPVATGINSSDTAAFKKAFSLATYAAGETGGPWAFIASENKMLKDSGKSLSGTLPLWGVLPASGVATAAVVASGAATISAIDYSYADYVGVVVTLSAPASMSDFDQVVIAGVSGVTITTTDGSTDINQNAPYPNNGWSIRIGVPESDGTIDPVKATKMFRIYDSNGQSVLGSGVASGSMTAFLYGTAGFPSAGNLDGGAESSPNASTPYDYRAVYVDDLTRNKGNPSQIMLADSKVTNGVPVAVHLGQVSVQVLGADLSALGTAHIGKINIYRRGGILYDAWRLITQVVNPGVGAWSPPYIDNAADADIVYNELMETDNDPPVPSTVTSSTGAKATINAITVPGRNTATVSGGSLSQITPGTKLRCFFDDPEDVIVESVSGPTFVAYFQHTQNAGTTVQADFICGQPCNLAISYQQFVIVAGDPNNPHLLYRSKGDQPEAFAVAPADNSVATAACGTPSNPILNLYAFRGQICTLNLYGIFETLIYGGSLVQPAQMAAKGTVGMRANCKTDTEIWFLSTDGVWSWDGSSCRKRSEVIDPIFHGQSINGLSPLDYTVPEKCVMEFRRGQVYLLYKAISGETQQIVCRPAFNDGWRAYDVTIPDTQFLYKEPDTESLVEAYAVQKTGSPEVGFDIDDQYVVSGGVDYTADRFSSTWVPPAVGTPGGASVNFDMRLPWFDMGSPASKKLFGEILLELDTSGSVSGPASITVEVLYDFSETVNAETMHITVPIPVSGGGRTVVSLLPYTSNDASPRSYGFEAKAISYHIYGFAWPTQITFYSLQLVYQDKDLLTSGVSGNWTDLGHPYDKRLFQMTVEFDTEGIDKTIVMDTMTGVGGNVYTPAVQTFVLSNPQIAGSGRAKKTFPVLDNTVVKQIRIRQDSTASAYNYASTVLFEIFSVEFPEMEKYPADIVSATPWEDDGYPFLKYINQATVSVNTNGVAVTAKVQADGATVATVVITSTDADRDRNLTLPTGLTGRRWRLYVDPTQAALTTGGGMFQLWNPGKIFRFQPADKGEVGHTFDWDDLGHPWDKYLRSVTIEWDNTSGANVTLQMDTITGLNGQTLTSDVAEFVLAGGRSKREFPLAKDTIVKMIRLYPKGTPPTSFRQWKYSFDKIDYPCDVIYSTEWRNADSPTDKNPSWLSIDADTNSVACTVNLENESGVVMTVFHTGSATDRMRNYPIPVDTFAKMWRLTVTPGINTKFQMFHWGFQRWQPTDQASPIDPPGVVTWTPWKVAESPTDKNPSWLYINAFTNSVPCLVSLVNENGVVLTVQHIGSHTNRIATYPIPVDIAAKMWRLLAAPGVSGVFQLWDWGFQRWQPTPQTSPVDPPAVVLWTPWSDWGWPYGSIARDLVLTIDTGGVPCRVDLETENGIVQTFSVTTTYASRRVVLSCDPNLIGLMWRLLLTPGAGGKSELWDWNLAVVQEPAALTEWSSYEQGFGVKGYKIARQVWLQYECASSVVLTITSDTGSYTMTLPPHTGRSTERRLLPSVFGTGLNKSTAFTLSWVAASPAKMYADQSGIEWISQGSEQRAGFIQALVSEFQGIPI